MAVFSLNLISICTGGAGLDLGFELAIPGARSVCMVEREAFACAELVAAMEQGLLPQAALWSDARTFDGRPWRGLVDGLIGGIPCQPHSLAGRKGGSNDPRDLWSTARRIIVQSRARLVLIENVSGMLSAGADEIAGAERVWRDLRKLGHSVEGGLFTASEVGTSQRRERLFILGVADSDDQQWRGQHELNIGQGERSRKQPGRDCNGDVADRAGSGCGREGDDGQRAAGPNGGCGDVIDAEVVGCGEGRTEPAIWRGRNAAASAGDTMGNADTGSPQEREGNVAIIGGRSEQPSGHRATGGNTRRHIGRQSLPASQLLAYAHSHEPAEVGRNAGEMPSDPQSQGRAEHGSALFGRFSLPNFPPGPSDRDSWRFVLERAPELEPSFRRVADGVASRLDIAQSWARVDRLRLLGNGVVPLEAAYAIRTLVTRLAARGSRGAAQLVRMMEGME